jgi:hypothetical protein
MRRLAGDRSESQHPREKSFAAECPLVEKRVLGVSWGVLGVQPVLGVLGSSCWSRGRRAMLNPPPDGPPIGSPWAPGQPTGPKAERRGAAPQHSTSSRNSGD